MEGLRASVPTIGGSDFESRRNRASKGQRVNRENDTCGAARVVARSALF